MTSSFRITQRNIPSTGVGGQLRGKGLTNGSPTVVSDKKTRLLDRSLLPLQTMSYFLFPSPFRHRPFSIDFDRTFVPRSTKLRTTCIRLPSVSCRSLKYPYNNNQSGLPICSCNSVTQTHSDRVERCRRMREVGRSPTVL